VFNVFLRVCSGRSFPCRKKRWRRGIPPGDETERLCGQVAHKFPEGKGQPYIPFHIGICKLEKLRLAHGTNHFAMKAKVYLAAVKAAYRELNRIKGIKVDYEPA